VKQIELKGFREDDIVQLMQEVDLVKKLSHPNVIKYEGIDRDENTLSIMLECVPIRSAPPSFGFGASSVTLNF